MTRKASILCVTSHPDRPEAETFIALQRLGYTVHVFCAPQARQRERLESHGVPLTLLHLNKNFDSAAIQAIRRHIIDHQSDILHLFNNRAVSNGLKAAKGLSIKIIAYRGIVGNVYWYEPMSWMRYLNPRIDRIVCVCDAIKHSLLNLRGPGTAALANKVLRIYKGHKIEWYNDQALDLSTLGIPNDAFVVISTSTWRPRKGIRYLVQAMGLLKDHPDIHLILVDTADNQDAQKLVQQQPNADNIHTLGYRNDNIQLVKACDVSVLPCLKREGLAKTIIEAMIQGVPNIVTPIGGNPELVVHEQTGLVVPVANPQALAEAILSLYKNRDEAHAFGKAGIKRVVEHFHHDATVVQTDELYQDLLKSA